MAGRHSALNPVTNDDTAAKSNMMDVWKESIERNQKQRQAPVDLAKSDSESRADLEQRIRNGQAECPTCAKRTYQDQSDDGGVSFQAAKHISAATAGVTVTGHEQEHVAAGEAEQARDGLIRNSTTALEYGKCPECGRTYVKGGVTRTQTRTASYRRQSGGLDMDI